MGQNSLSKLIKLFIFSISLLMISEIEAYTLPCNCDYVLNLSSVIDGTTGAEGLTSNGSILLAGRSYSGTIRNQFLEYNMSISQTNTFYAVNDTVSTPWTSFRSLCISGNQIWLGWEADAKADPAFGYQISVYNYPTFGDQFIATYNDSCYDSGNRVNIACNENYVYNLCANYTVFKRSLSDYSLVSSFVLPFTPTTTYTKFDVSDDDDLFVFANGYDQTNAYLVIFNTTDVIYNTNMSSLMETEEGWYWPHAITFNGNDTCEFFLGNGEVNTIQKIGCLLDCVPPASGDWIIDKGLNCVISDSDTVTGNVNISDGSLQIAATGALTVSGGYIYVYPGNNFTVLSGGQING